MQLVTTLRADLAAAMKDRDRLRTRVIRSLLAAIGNAEASAPGDPLGEVGLYSGEGARRELESSDLRSIVAAELEERDEFLAEHGSLESAGDVREERDIIAGYLALL